MPMVTCSGTPDAGNLHVRCDEGGVAGGNAGPRYSTVNSGRHHELPVVELRIGANAAKCGDVNATRR